MSNYSADPHTPPPGTQFYVIRIADRLDTDWGGWFDGMSIRTDAENRTLLTGYVRDQAQLFGILYKLCGLNLTLLSVQSLDSPKEQ